MRQSLSALCSCAFVLAVCTAGACLAQAQAPGTFTATGSMTAPRYHHTATLLNDGRVLIAGGFGSGFEAQASAELYDPATGIFSATGGMTAPRAYHSTLLLPDGRVLLAGGQLSIFGGGGAPPAGVELYDPSTGTFTRVANFDSYTVTVTLLPNGLVLLTGPLPLNATPAALLYNPATGALSPAAERIPPRLGTSATLLPNGQVLFNNAGLAALSPPTVGGGELYDPVTRTFRPTGDDVHYDIANILLNGDVWLVRTDEVSTLAFSYHPSTGTSTPAATPRSSVISATLLADGALLLLDGTRTGSAQLYDPVTSSISGTSAMITPRIFSKATLLPNGQVLLTGGYVLPAPDSGPPGPPLAGLATAELYTPPGLVPAPLLFSLAGDGRGQGAIWHAATGQIVSPDSPATAGEVLSLYTTSLMGGSVIPPQVSIGGRLTEISYFGPAPGYAGFSQVNIRMPAGLSPNSAAPVRLTYLGRPSNEITIAVQ